MGENAEERESGRDSDRRRGERGVFQDFMNACMCVCVSVCVPRQRQTLAALSELTGPSPLPLPVV